MNGPRLLRHSGIEAGQATLSGTRYGQLNQDYTLLRQFSSAGDSPEIAAWAAAVLDGHGMLGERAASTAGEALVDYLQSKLSAAGPTDADVRQRIVVKAFQHAHEAALGLYRTPPEHYTYPVGSRMEDDYSLTYSEGLPMYKSAFCGAERLLEFGTTCTIAVVQEGWLTIGNVGDSGAVLGSRSPDGLFCGEELTVRHWGLNSGEADRISSSKGRRVGMEADGYISVAAGRFKGYQLSMTRALGHSMLADFGVIATPFVLHQQLRPQDTCLILASDGVWDVFEPGEAVELVMSTVEGGCSAAVAAEQLCKEAVDRAIDGEDGEADNTSAIVLAFNQTL